MIKILMKTFTLILLLSALLPLRVSASSGFTDVANLGGDMRDWQTMLSQPIEFLVKRGEPYDESKDPALRRGSENSEQPQMDFFIMPIALFVGMGLFLLYNKL